MRAFIGIPLDPGSAAALARASVFGRESDDATMRRARWVSTGNLHLTLRFLGEIDTPSAHRLADEVAEACDGLQPFGLPLARAVTPVPSATRTSMLWSVFDDPGGECATLMDRVSSAIMSVGMPPESRPFTPHVTLVRFRRPTSISESLLKGMDAEVMGALGPDFQAMSVPRVTLYSSTLTRHGATYSKVWELPLGSR